ncbi:MAG TPA: hypothetical protein VFZ99_01600 [Terriglobales bacterium]
MAEQDKRRKENQQQERRGPAEQPSGYSGETPATAGGGKTSLRSHTPENSIREINPSSPTQGTEAPSTNISSPTTAGGEGMGSMGYGGSDKPRSTDQQVQDRPKAVASQDNAAAPEKKQQDPGSATEEQKKEVA